MWTYGIREVTKEQLAECSSEVLLEAIKTKTFEISPTRWTEIEHYWISMSHGELVRNIDIHNKQCSNSYSHYMVDSYLLKTLTLRNMQSPKIKTCTCGAKYTSFPNHHYEKWCDLFN